MDTDSSFLTKIPKDHKVLGAGYINEGDTQKTSDYDITMDLYVAKIDKMIRIHGGPYTSQFINVTL